jgi:hypothetical protein
LAARGVANPTFRGHTRNGCGCVSAWRLTWAVDGLVSKKSIITPTRRSLLNSWQDSWPRNSVLLNCRSPSQPHAWWRCLALSGRTAALQSFPRRPRPARSSRLRHWRMSGYFAVSVGYVGFPLFQRSQYVGQCTTCHAHAGSFFERFAAEGGLPLSLRATHAHTEQLTCNPAAASRVPVVDANTGDCATAIELALAVASELGQPISSWVPPNTTHNCTVNGQNCRSKHTFRDESPVSSAT